MKKILALLIASAMILTIVPAISAEYGDDMERSDSWGPSAPIYTEVTVAGGSTSDPTPFIKYKWELVEELDDCSPSLVNDDPDHDYLSVALNPGGTRTIHYFAIVKKTTYDISHVYADVWHPDKTFKYQIQLTKLSLNDGISAWNYVTTNYPEVLNKNGKLTEDWAATLEELQQEDAFVYEGEAELSYCQPAGWYTVCVRAVDSHGGWSDPLWNWFWYIPTASIELDFDTILYGSAPECEWKWVSGDTTFDSMSGIGPNANPPTVRNIGNVPVVLRFQQDDMGFGKTYTGTGPDDWYWNVKFDARLGDAVYAVSEGRQVEYEPGELSDAVGTLSMCTQDKLDFSIHIIKGTSGETYSGNLFIYAYTDTINYGSGPYPTSPYGPFYGEQAPTGTPVPTQYEP